MRTLSEPRPVASWGSLGVRRLDGSRLPRASIEASLLTLDGRAFLVYRNYEAILGYNCGHRYALSVAMLADAHGSDVPPPSSGIQFNDAAEGTVDPRNGPQRDRPDPFAGN